MGCECKALKGIPGMGKTKLLWLVQHISHRRSDQAQEFNTELYTDFDDAKDAYYEMAKEEVDDLTVFDDMFDEFSDSEENPEELIAWSTVSRQYIHTFRLQRIAVQ